jgi:TP901 family phage tail tape measure protein
MQLEPLSLSVTADLSGIKSIAREMAGLGRQSKTTGQEIGRGLASGARESARAFGGAGDDAAKEFGKGFGSVGDQIKGAFKQVDRDAGDSGKRAGKSFGDGFKGGIGNIFAGIGQGIGQSLTAGLGNAVGALKNFATNRDAYMRMDGAKAGLKSLGADVGDLETRAKAATKELKNMASTTELMASSYDIVSSGFSGGDAIKIATTAKKAAVASPDSKGATADTAVVGDAMTSVMNAFKVGAEDADKVAAQMIGTVNAGKIQMGEYASLIGQVASVAAESGVALHELNGAIATSTVAGVPASSAMAGIKAALGAIAKPSSDAADLAASVGLNFNAAAVRSKGFIGVLQDIKAAGLGTSDGIYKLFGSTEAWTALSPVIGKLGEDYQKIEDTVKGVNLDQAFEDGSKSAARLQDKLAAMKEEFDLKFQTAVAPIFEAGSVALGQMMGHLNEGGVLFEGLNQAAAGFRDFLAQNPEIITAMSVAFAELLNGGVLLLQQGILNFTNALRENPQLIQQMITGIVGAVTATVQFAQGMGQAFGFMAQMLAPIGSLITVLTGADAASQGMAQTFGQIAAWVVTIGGGLSIVASVIGAISSVAGAVSGIAATIGTAVGAIGAALVPIGLALAAVFIWVENIRNYSANWNDVLLGINYTWNEMIGWIGGVFNAIGQTLQQSNLFKGLWESITKVVQSLVKPYQDIFNSVVQLVQKSEFFRGIWDGIKGLAQAVGNAFTSFVGGVLDGLIQKAQQLFGWIQGMAGFKGGGGGGNASLNIAGLNDVQQKNAAAIAQEGKAAGLNENQIAAMIAGAMQESQLGTLNDEIDGYGGKGLFQLTDEPGQSGTWIGKGGITSVKDYYDPNKNVKAIMEDFRFGEWKESSKGMSPEAAATSFAKMVLRPYEVGDKYADKARKLFPGGDASKAIQFSGGSNSGGATQLKGSISGTFDASGQNGADMDVGPNNEMHSYHNGVVTQMGNAGNNGNYVVIEYLDDLGNKLEATYSHIASAVQIGQQVQGGQVLGKFDASGRTFGAHNSIDINTPGTNGALQRSQEGDAARRGAEILVTGKVQGQPGYTGGGGMQFQMPPQMAMPQFQMPKTNAIAAPQFGKVDNSLAAPPPNKNDETQAMAAAVELARKKEDAATKQKREEAARTLKQTREDQKLKLEGQKAGLVSPDAKDAQERAMKEIEVRAQYEDRLLDLQQKRDDLATARDRKKKDMKSPDVAAAAAAKALPDFSAQINAYDKLIAKDKELQTQALKNITISDEAKQSEADRASAIERRNNEIERAAELEKAMLQGRLEAAQRSNPLEAAAIESQIKRRDLQVALNKEVQVELDKLGEVERALAELAKMAQESSPQAKRLQSERQSLMLSTATRQASNKVTLQNFDAEDNDNRSKLQRDRNAALLEKDQFLAEPKSKARGEIAGQMRRVGNVEGAMRLEKENALIQLGLSYRQKQIELEAKIADMRSRGAEISEQEAAGYRKSLEAQQKFDLSNINRQFDVFQSEIMPTVQESVGGFFKDLVSGTKSVGEALSDMLGNIASKLLDFATNQIISSIFGGLFGGGAGKAAGGKVGGGILSILGFADGGVVGGGSNMDALRRQPGAIGDALRREGNNSVLSALTPGEMVLTVAQTQAFLNNPMSRDILNFKGGGLVPGGAGIIASGASGSSVSVIVPVTVNGGGNQVDWSKAQSELTPQLEMMITNWMTKQRRDGGMLS